MGQDGYHREQDNYRQAFLQPPTPPQSAGTNGMAIGSLICGLATFVTGVSAILAVVFGHIALGQIKGNPRQGGRGMAVAGLIMGYAGGAIMLIVVLMAKMPALTLPRLDTAREQARRASCLSQVRMVGLALRMYADMNKGHYPTTVPEERGMRDPLQALGLVCHANYVDDTRLLMCPSDKHITADWFNPDNYPGEQPTRANCSYSVNVLQDVTSRSDPSTALISDEPLRRGENSGNHGLRRDGQVGEGQNVFRLGGDAKWFLSSENDSDPNMFEQNRSVENDAYIPDTGP